MSGKLGEVAPERVAGSHLNLGSVELGTFDDPTPEEMANLEAAREFARTGRGYSGQQATRPQTLGYGLTELPGGPGGLDRREVLGLDGQQILDEISVYWFTASATSSARLYWESFASFRDTVSAPSGLSVYPRDITRSSQREAQRWFTDVRWFEEVPRGGHFAALEQPESLIGQIRRFFRLAR